MTMTTQLRSRSLTVEASEQATVSDLHQSSTRIVLASNRRPPPSVSQFRSFSARGTPSPVTPRAGSSSRRSATTIHRTPDFPGGDEPDGNNPRASQVRGYGDGALRHLFYSGLPDRIKDEISRVGKPNTLYGLRALAQEIDARYWEHKDEVARQTKSSGGSSSNNTSNKGNSSKGDKQKSGGNTPASTNTPTPSTSTPKPQNQQSSRQPSGLSNKLGKDGKLTPAERKRCFDQSLCMFCGNAGHKARECPRSTSRAAKVRVA
ncbi:hypothetical protein PISMIDRAFT_74899, partial [Pisolithus microcarpus 441]